MRTIEAKENVTVCIGYQGENRAAQVIFHLSEFSFLQNIEEYEFTLIIKTGNNCYTPEIYELSNDRKDLIWIPTLTDMEVVGIREAEIKAQKEQKVALSSIYRLNVKNRL